MRERAFYIIQDEFFQDMNDPYLKGNKEASRPHYYCFKEEETGLFWMIPLSSRVDKYKNIMNKKLQNRKSCDIIHIMKLDNGKESVFLIQDMFPITENYIERKYTIAHNHLVVTSEHSAIEIEKKAKKVMNMLKKGIKFTPTQSDIKKIMDKLKTRKRW